jgi:hypothetical protein
MSVKKATKIGLKKIAHNKPRCKAEQKSKAEATTTTTPSKYSAAANNDQNKANNCTES